MQFNAVQEPRGVLVAITKDISKKRVLSTRETAEEIGASPRTLEKWRRPGNRRPDGSIRGPAWTVREGRVIYTREAIEEYLAKNTVSEEDDFVA